MLEFIAKHFISIGEGVTDATAGGAVNLPNPKATSFTLMAWTPSSPGAAVGALRSTFLQHGLHPNLKKAVLACLTRGLQERSFPAYDREANVNRQWLEAGLWLAENGHLDPAERLAMLRSLVFAARDDDVRTELMRALRRYGGETYPARSGRLEMPRDWNRTWQWALRTADIDTDEAVAFLCQQMRTRGAIPDGTKRALLTELKRLIGDEFPLPPGDAIDLETAWPTCGRWLVERGYFGEPGEQ
jgi:hypothetical protein